MSRDPLDIVWRCADSPAPVLQAEELDAMFRPVLDRLLKLGLMRQAATATHVACDACPEQHVSNVIRAAYPDGSIRFFIMCPRNGRVEVPRDRLLQWSVDYLPMLQVLASALSARAAPREIIAGRVWNLGRASLAGKSKPIWAARGLAWPDAVQVAAALPQGRSPVVLVLGQPPDNGLLGVPVESIIELRTVVHLDETLSIDREAIESQLSGTGADPAKKKQMKKQGHRDATVGAIKRELHRYILSMKSRIRHADDTGELFETPRLLQKQLAEAIGVSECSVSRAICRSPDREMKVLLETANNAEMIRKYSR